MTIFKCKMCGGDLNIDEGMTVAECEYCGTKQTVSKSGDEVVANLFSRANNLRLKCEFDKAEQVYEKLLDIDNTDAEAHWGIVLCKYGIEYVEDPKTYKRIPTCHRTLYEAITTDANYISVLENADIAQKTIYEQEAKVIAEIQKNILHIVNGEKPFDVFICYKETDENGKRTPDSAIANDIYHQLTQEGFKVFYAAITLEDKLGQEYEPYIFAALNSAKVMLVVGTKSQYFDAVWVRNEWSRFLKLTKTDRQKLLIPCYKDMDAYELPEAFAHLQAQDMGKIGFINDVVRGIKKVIVKDEPKETVVKETVVTNTNNNTAALLERAFLFLEDGNWESADEYFEKVLDNDPKCANAYLGKLMVEMRINKQENLKNCTQPFDENNNYQKAIRFGDENFKNELKGYIDFIITRNIENAYQKAVGAMKSACSENDFASAANLFEQLGDYKDSKQLAVECRNKAEEAELENLYYRACGQMNKAQKECEFKSIAEKFNSIKHFKDAEYQAKICLEKAEYARKDEVYVSGIRYMNTNNTNSLQRAIEKFKLIEDFKDAADKIIECEQQIIKLEKEKEEEKIIANKKTAKKRILIFGISIAVSLILIASFVLTSFNFNPWNNIKTIQGGLYISDDNSIISIDDYYKDWTDIVSVSSANLKQIVTVGLKSNGTVVAKGDNSYGQCDVSEWTDIVEITAGCGEHTVGLKSDGTVVAVGNNNMGQCNVSEWTDIVAISAGWQHTVGVKSNGTIVFAGDDNNTRFDVSDWTNIKTVFEDNFIIVGIKNDNTVVAKGVILGDSEDVGQCDVTDWTNIVAVDTGDDYTVGLKSDGTVVATGKNNKGQCDVSDWTNIVAISVDDETTVGLKSDGTVVVTGEAKEYEDIISTWTDVVAVEATNGYSGDVSAVKSDGTAVETIGYSGGAWKGFFGIDYY